MLSIYTTDLSGDLLRHQDIVNGNPEQYAERQHIVDAGQGVAPQPLVHRAHVRNAEHPANIRDRIPAVLYQVPYIRTGPHRIDDRIVHFLHHSFPTKNTASSGQESGIALSYGYPDAVTYP